MCVVVGSRPLIPLMAGLHLQHVDVVAKVPELLWVVSPKVVLWSHAGGVCCMEGLLVHSLRFRQLRLPSPARRKRRDRSRETAAAQPHKARRLASSTFAAQIVSEGEKKNARFFP